MAAKKKVATTAKLVVELTVDEAVQEHKALTVEIANHDRLYHQEDAPEISDAAYDALRARLEEIESIFPELSGPTSPTRRVGAPPSPKFAKVTHKVPMLSLGNVFAEDEMRDFLARVKRFLGFPLEYA